MKKYFFVFIIAVSASICVFTSCENSNRAYCWEFSDTNSGYSQGKGWFWGTRAEAEIVIAPYGGKFKRTSKSESECRAAYDY